MGTQNHKRSSAPLTSDAVDALSTSLFEHAQAHRGHAPDADRIATTQINKDLLPALNSFPSPLHAIINRFLRPIEQLPRPFFNLKIKTVAAYHFFGITGIITACACILVLTGIFDQSLLISTVLLLVAALLTWAYIKITMLITKRDAVVFFNYFLTLLTGVILALRILNQPVLPYLDILIVGAGLLFAFGRIGCFMAGCCYGKPAQSGIRYDKFHKKNGFPRTLLRVRLIPTQLIESGWLFFVTISCMLLLFWTDIPGIALTTFLLLLSIGRFMLEFYRGDPARPYVLGLSQAQWTSLALLLGTISFQALNILPFQIGHSFILVSFLILLITLVFRSSNVSRHELYSAKHVHELARTFDIFRKGSRIPASTRKAVHIKKTSLDIQLSENHIPIPGHRVLHHITLSSVNQQLRYNEALGLSKLMAGWYQPVGINVLLPDSNNIYHLIQFTTDS